mmetsp:Transcript_96956/g.134677  ORF Transcript_96956/g.134677 Transcript_96956/m.134677 type:complete len:114 (-) Transcript_96956:281-622(-)
MRTMWLVGILSASLGLTANARPAADGTRAVVTDPLCNQVKPLHPLQGLATLAQSNELDVKTETKWKLTPGALLMWVNPSTNQCVGPPTTNDVVQCPVRCRFKPRKQFLRVRTC